MNYISVVQAAELWGVSERIARNYCASGKIEGAFFTGTTWNIPEDAQRPNRINQHKYIPKNTLDVLRRKKASKVTGGTYHKIQVELT